MTRDLVRISTARERFFLCCVDFFCFGWHLFFQDWQKNLAVRKRFGNFFRLGVIPILPTQIFCLNKQTNKGVEWLRPNTEYSCALNFLLCFVHYVQLDKSTSSELVREWLRWANIILVFIFMWSHGPTFVAERQSK